MLKALIELSNINNFTPFKAYKTSTCVRMLIAGSETSLKIFTSTRSSPYICAVFYNYLKLALTSSSQKE